MASAAKSKGSKAAVWTILVLLIVGLAGFGTTNFGGSVDSIGTVGSRDIDLQRYARALQEQIRARSVRIGTNLSIVDATEMGIDRVVLENLVATAALENEAARLGLSVGDETVREAILRIPSFQGLDGNFDKETYSFVLDSNGLDERSFEEDVRHEIARNLVQDAVTGGIAAPDIYVDTIFKYNGERRDFAFASLGADRLESEIPRPTPAELRTYFDGNAEEFMLPETRGITYTWLTPEMLTDTVEVDEEALRSLYQENIDDYVIPERRLVERLVLGDEASEAKARIDAGDATFEDIVAERDLELGDIDLGDVTEADLGSAGAAVFASDGPAIIGPEDTEFGSALFRVNAVLPALNTSFDEARSDLTDQFTAEQARQAIADMIDGFDDLLAGGATIEELTDETEMRLGRVDWTVDTVDDIADYPAFRQAATNTVEGDFPEITTLEDGGVFALRIDSITEPRLPDFNSVATELEEGWRAEMTAKALADQARTLVDAINGGTEPADLGLQMRQESGIRRDGFVSEAPFGLLDTVFGMSEGEVTIHEGETAAYVIRLDGVAPPDMNDEANTSQRDFIRQNAGRDLGAELLVAYSRQLEVQADVALDRAAINAVHAQFP